MLATYHLKKLKRRAENEARYTIFRQQKQKTNRNLQLL
jgi:hypothetical protein